MHGLILANVYQTGVVPYDLIPNRPPVAPVKAHTDWIGFLIALAPWFIVLGVLATL